MDQSEPHQLCWMTSMKQHYEANFPWILGVEKCLLTSQKVAADVEINYDDWNVPEARKIFTWEDVPERIMRSCSWRLVGTGGYFYMFLGLVLRKHPCNWVWWRLSVIEVSTCIVLVTEFWHWYRLKNHPWYDAAAADTAGVADAAAAGDPWVVRRADAMFFWRFLESFFLSMELMFEALFCTMRIILSCTGMALKGAILSVAGKGKILWEWDWSWCFSLR